MEEILRYGLVFASCIVGGGGGLYYSSRPTNMRAYMINNGKTPLRYGDPLWRYKEAIKKNKERISTSEIAVIWGSNQSGFDDPSDQQAEALRDYCTRTFKKHPRYVSTTIKSNLETFCTY